MPPPEKLPQAYLALLGKSEAQEKEISALKSEMAAMELKLALFQKKIFGGGQSEKLDRLQLALKLEGEPVRNVEHAKEKVTYERRVPAGEKRPAPAELFAKLPVGETVTVEPAEVVAAPGDFERIGEERSFEVEIQPPAIFKREFIRPKYRRKDRTEAPVVAPAPARPVNGGYASAGLLAWVAMSKYRDHLPLYRQEQMLARWGAPIARQTLSDWIRIAAEWLEPIYRKMKEELLRGGYIQVDETPVKCNDPDEAKGGTTQGYLWLMSKPGGDVVFDWRLSRRHGELTSLVDGFAGILQSDGYEAYASHARSHPEVLWVGCWAHARRKWIEAQSESPQAVRVALKLIARMYRLERDWNEADRMAGRRRSAQTRAELRLSHFGRSLRWLRALALSQRSQARPKSRLGEAAHYLLSQWDPLTRHLETGQSELDNNLVENAVRPSAIGKKNWLFIGHPDAGQRSAILYSIILSCERHGKEPLAYLRDVLSRLPKLTNQDDLTLLTPRLWSPPPLIEA